MTMSDEKLAMLCRAADEATCCGKCGKPFEPNEPSLPAGL